MTLKLKPSASPPPFSFENLPSTPPPPSPSPSLSHCPSPPTSWLSARDMKVFGSEPLRSATDIGIVQCKECAKPVLRSAAAEHAGQFGPHITPCVEVTVYSRNGMSFVQTTAEIFALVKVERKVKLMILEPVRVINYHSWLMHTAAC